MSEPSRFLQPVWVLTEGCFQPKLCCLSAAPGLGSHEGHAGLCPHLCLWWAVWRERWHCGVALGGGTVEMEVALWR